MEAFDLDNFDQWFSTFDHKDSFVAPSATVVTKTTTTKSLNPTLRIYDDAEDDNGSDSDNSDNIGGGRRNRRGPERGMMQRRLSGALEQLFVAPVQKQPTDGSSRKSHTRRVPDEAKSKAKPLCNKSGPQASKTKTVGLLSGCDLQKAKEARGKRMETQKKAQERKQSVSDSLGKFLGDMEDGGLHVDDEVTEYSGLSGPRRKVRQASHSKKTNPDLKLSCLYGKKGSAECDSIHTEPTEALSDTSLSSSGDSTTEVARDDERSNKPLRRSTREAHREMDGHRLRTPSPSCTRSSSVGPMRHRNERKRDSLSVSSHRKSDEARRAHSTGKSLFQPKADAVSSSRKTHHGISRSTEQATAPRPNRRDHDSLSSSRHGATAKRQPRRDPLSQSEHGGANRHRHSRPADGWRDPLQSYTAHGDSGKAVSRRQAYARTASLKTLQRDDEDEGVSCSSELSAGNGNGNGNLKDPDRRRTRRDELGNSEHGGMRQRPKYGRSNSAKGLDSSSSPRRLKRVARPIHARRTPSNQY